MLSSFGAGFILKIDIVLKIIICVYISARNFVPFAHAKQNFSQNRIFENKQIYTKWV